MTAPVLASANRAQLQFITETTFGTTPGSGNGTKLRMTGESLDYALTKTGDKEIRSDRQNVSTTTTDAAPGGDIKFHMQYAEYDPFIAGVLQNPATAYGTNGVGTSFTATFSATTIVAAAAPTGSSAFETGIALGQWFKVNAGANTNDGKFLRSSTLTANITGTIYLDASTPAVTAASVTGVTIATSRFTNGTTMVSFSIERAMADVTQYMTYRGMNVSKMSISFSSGALTEGSFTFMGKDSVINTATQLPGSIGASQTYTIQNAVTGVGNLWEAGVPLTSTYIKKLDLSIDSTLRGQKALGTLGNVGIGSGTFHVSGTMDVYFADGSLYTKYLNDTFTSLTISTRDTAKNGYVITLPNIMITKATIQAGSKDTDLMASISFEAYADSTNATASLQKTIFIDRCGAAVTPL